MHVSSLAQTTAAISYIDQQSTALAQVQNEVSTGLKVNQPSDDPVAFAQISQIKTAAARLTAYTQNISSATSTLNDSVSTLTNVNNLLVQAQQLAQQGADASTNSDQTNRDALASQVNSLIGEALSDANSQPGGKSLYAGTATGTVPFTVATTNASGQPESVAYNGTAQNTATVIGQGQTVSTQYAGSAVFQQSGADVFQALIGLRDDLQNTSLTGAALNQSLNQRITSLTSARDAINTVTGTQSSDLATLQTLSTTASNAQLADQTQLGNLQSTDYASAVVQVQQDQTALQAIYATTAQMLQPGFLSFLQSAGSTA
jgi:flagellar hook-associated protein 3 FlgL